MDYAFASLEAVDLTEEENGNLGLLGSPRYLHFIPVISRRQLPYFP